MLGELKIWRPEDVLHRARVRLVQESDMERVSDLLHFWFVDYQIHENQPPAMEEVEEYIGVVEKTLSGENRFFVADVNNTAMGLFGYTNEVDPYLQEVAAGLGITDPIQYRLLFLDPSVRHMGLGKKLVDEVGADALSRNPPRPHGLFFSHQRFSDSSWRWHDQNAGFKHVDTIMRHEQLCRIYSVDLVQRFGAIPARPAP